MRARASGQDFFAGKSLAVLAVAAVHLRNEAKVAADEEEEGIE